MELPTVRLASDLISIPSYVSEDCDEQSVVAFLASYIKKHMPSFDVEISSIEGSKRANLYIKGSERPRLTFVGHVDTVQPSGDWMTPPLTPTIKDDKLYGLGAADMKGSIASLLVALQNIDPALLSEVAILLYVDEEYRFAGMKQLLEDEVCSINEPPELFISLDGGLKVLSGCRGLLKLDMELVGKSGHASDPANGINAITQTVAALDAVETRLQKYQSELGTSTMNVARLNGGAVADVNEPGAMQRSGNVIPNYAECIVEVRTASNDLDGVELERLIREESEARGLSVKSIDTRIDLGVWQSTLTDDADDFLRRCYDTAKITYDVAEPQTVGYIDVQMLAVKVPVPMCVIGAGGENRHGANENVPIENLEAARELYQTIITKFIGE